MSPSRIQNLSRWKESDKGRMKRVVLFLLWFSLAGVVSAQNADERAVLRLSKVKFDWLVSRNADSIGYLLDDRVKYVHSNGWTQSKAEVLADMASGKLLYQRVTIKEASVRMYGETAIVDGAGTFEGANSGTAFTLVLRYTEVYIRSSGRWRLASRHANRLP